MIDGRIPFIRQNLQKIMATEFLDDEEEKTEKSILNWLIKATTSPNVYQHLRQNGALLTIEDIQFNTGQMTIKFSSKLATLSELYRYFDKIYRDFDVSYIITQNPYQG